MSSNIFPLVSIILCFTINVSNGVTPVDNFVCPGNTVMAVQSYDPEVNMMFYCAPAEICDESPSSSFTSSGCPNTQGKKLMFMKGFRRNPGSGVVSPMCSMFQNPEDFDKTGCSAVFVAEPNQPSTTTTPDGPGGNPTNAPNDPAAGNGGDPPPPSPGSVSPFFLNKEVVVPSKVLFVNDIQRVSGGYSVTVCNVECKEKTTTSTTSTTTTTGAPETTTAQGKDGPAGVPFSCPAGQVLAVSGQTASNVKTYCVTPNVCDKPNFCNYQTSPIGCVYTQGKQLNFLAAVNQGPDGRLKRCCTMYPPRELTSTDCASIFINVNGDKVIKPGNGDDNKSDNPGSGQSPSVKAGGPEGNFPPPPPPSVNSKGQPVKGLPHTYLTDVDVTPAQQFLVNNIVHNADGSYLVVACMVSCENDKTTTTQNPTTQRDSSFEQPDYAGDNVDSVSNDWVPQQKPDKPIEHQNGDAKGPGGFQFPPFMFNVPSTGGFTCFSGDSLVQTKHNGRKQMRHLNQFDQVLVSTAVNGEPKFETIDMWYHRVENVKADFIEIQTELNQTISISANHLIPIFTCGEKLESMSKMMSHSKFASKAKTGYCVLGQAENGKLQPTMIKKVTGSVQKGIYSPITASGSVIVNGVQASCYSTFEHHNMAHLMHQVLAKMYSAADMVTHYLAGFHYSEWSAHTTAEIPSLLKALAHLANAAVPSTMF